MFYLVLYFRIYSIDMTTKAYSEVDTEIMKHFDTDKSDIKEVTESKEIDIIVGIDLGTSNSCIGIWRNKNLVVFGAFNLK